MTSNTPFTPRVGHWLMPSSNDDAKRQYVAPANLSKTPVNDGFLGQTTVTTATTTVTTNVMRDGATTIKRMKQMAEEQHHRSVELQANNCQLTNQVKQLQDQVSHLKKSLDVERQEYSNMKNKQIALDKHVEDFNGILESIDLKHVRLSSNLNKLQTCQDDFDMKLLKSVEDIKGFDSNQVIIAEKYRTLEVAVNDLHAQVQQASRLNKELSDELVKSKTLIAEKTSQETNSAKQLEALRDQQIKQESSMSEAKAKYDSELQMYKKNLNSMQEELARTLNNLNETLVSRQKEQDARKLAEENIFKERNRFAASQKLMNKTLQQFRENQRIESGKLTDLLLNNTSRWMAIVLSCENDVSLVKERLRKLKNDLFSERQSLERQSKTISTLTKENNRMNTTITQLNAKIESVLCVSEKNKIEAESAVKSKSDLQNQLISLKEEQKQYCLALSTKNADEMDKMQTKIHEQVKRVEEKYESQLKTQDKKLEASKNELQQMKEKCQLTNKKLQEQKKAHESKMKEYRESCEHDLRDQASKHDTLLKELEMRYKEKVQECLQLSNQVAESQRYQRQLLNKHTPEMANASMNAASVQRGTVPRKENTPPPRKSQRNKKSVPQTPKAKKGGKAHNQVKSPKSGSNKILKSQNGLKEDNVDDLFGDAFLDPYAFDI